MPDREGDHWVIDDRTGRKVLASETVREWTGAIVHRDHAIDLKRHPQEFQRIVNEPQSVPNPRPRGVDVYIGPLTTTIAANATAGNINIEVASTVRFLAGDKIGIMLSNGDLYRAVVQTVTDASHLALTAALPWAVETDALVVDFSAVSPSDVA